MKVVGLMSGTSMDGVDAALVDVVGDGPGPMDVECRLVAFRSVPYAPDRRELLRAVVDVGNPEAICHLHASLGEWLAEATLGLLEESGTPAGDVAVIGSHGHTLRHDPPAGGRRGATLQLGDPATVAARTGIPVVADFRAADVAAGGEGAPLVPWPDRILFARPGVRRALQNLGGIGNVTWLPPRGSDEDPVAFDTGPGNVLLDIAADLASGGRLACDRDGMLARAGTPDQALVRRLLEHPFLFRAPPRSTGRETFGPELVERLAGERGLEIGARSSHPGEGGRGGEGGEGGEEMDRGWRDLLASLTLFTARTVGKSYREWVLPRGVDEVVVTGGGARNPELVRLLRETLDPVPVRTGADALGMDPDAREAAAFAILAWAHLRGLPANVPSVTGAAGPRVLGSLTPAPGRATP